MRLDRHFDAMGTHAHVLVFADTEIVAARLVRDAQERIEQLEARWSRFRPTSELNALNACAGMPAVVSADTVRLVESMQVGVGVTEGAYDPTILADITALGYDRDFEQARADQQRRVRTRRPEQPGSDEGATRVRSELAAERRRGKFDAITVSPKSGLVWLPEGVGIDPGGIGKGLAADIVAEELLASGARGALVNLGGDLRVVGAPDDSPVWAVDVDDPSTGAPATTVALVDGGLATSSTEKRAWWHDGRAVHHVIDPATGTSTDRSIIGASVIAREAWRAEVLTKACIVRGGHGLALVDRFGAAARVTRRDGRQVTNAMWARHELKLRAEEEVGTR
jgi:thiamine biosynthesis lipoprotein